MIRSASQPAHALRVTALGAQELAHSLASHHMRRTCARPVVSRPLRERPAPPVPRALPRLPRSPFAAAPRAVSRCIPQPPRRHYADGGIVPTGGRDLTPPSGPGGSIGHLESEVQLQSSERGLNIFPYRVLGHETQVVEIDLLPENVIRAEVGSLLYMTQGVEMETKADGFQSGLKRMLTGESFFITDFRNTNPSGVAKVAFGGNYPSKVLPLRLDQLGGELVRPPSPRFSISRQCASGSLPRARRSVSVVRSSPAPPTRPSRCTLLSASPRVSSAARASCCSALSATASSC